MKNLWLYNLVRTLVVGFCKLFWRVEVEGRENVPTEGAFILSPVHRSNIDTPLAACVTRKRLCFMGKQEMWKVKPIGKLFDALGSFPVNRGAADRDALRKCIELLQAGESLVLFPEGTRKEGPVVQELFDGAAYIAAKTGVPIVPVGIGGSERAMPRGSKLIRPVKVRMVVGPPLRAERSDEGRVPRKAVHELTERLQAELQRVYDEAQKRVSGG